MVLFNFVSIKAGGGQQNALSFLENIKTEILIFKYVVACTENTLVHRYCVENGIEVFVVKNNIKSRILFEFFGFIKINSKYNIKTIFTIFGSAPLISFNVYKISGCAYSNIFQPEIDIWGYLGGIKKKLKKIIDFFRIFSLYQSDEIILETEFLKKKALSGILKNKKVSVIEMAPSKLITDNLRNIESINLYKEIYNFLYLSGPQPNKRIDKFLDVIFFLNKDSSKKYILKLTMPEDSNYFKEILYPKIKKLNIEDYVVNLGTIVPQNVSRVIQSSDAIVNVALIESFSNNWVEAWASNRLLISTDADWSRASCKEAALYIDVLKPEIASSLIKNIFNNLEAFSIYLENGKKRLKEMPTSRERTKQYISLINNSLES